MAWTRFSQPSHVPVNSEFFPIRLSDHQKISFLCVFSIITSHIWYWSCTAHDLFCKNLVCAMPQIDKNASSVPGLTNGKWPVSLGQLEGPLKNVVGSFPITTGHSQMSLKIYLSLVTVGPLHGIWRQKYSQISFTLSSGNFSINFFYCCPYC